MRLTPRLALLAIVLLAGCGRAGGGSTVSGTVKYQGKPLNNGYVLLVFDDGTQANGTIAVDGSGTYTIRAPKTGHAKVAVGSPKPAEAANPALLKGRGATKSAEPA